MSTETKPSAKNFNRVLDPTSSEAKRLLASFDEKTMEPKRFSDLPCKIRPAKPSSPS